VTPVSIVKIDPSFQLNSFDCGSEDLNRFLIRFALTNQQADASVTYLALAGNEIVGYYTLVYGDVGYDDAPNGLKKGLARHPVPLMILARLAIDRRWQGRRIGSGLLKDAMIRTLKAAEIAGIRAFAVHAKDDDAVAFYARFPFVPSPVDPFHLFLPMKVLRRSVGA
jgi:GNAT superfamily N-acetyltransferase